MKTYLLRILWTLPQRYLQVFSTAINLGLGKGWGASTVEDEVDLVLRTLKESSSVDLTIFDVGANVGSYTQEWLKRRENCRVVSFEPSSHAFQRLLVLFQGDKRVLLVNSACSDTNGTTQLFSDGPGSGLASLTKRRLDHFGILFDHQERVRTTTLDSWCKDNEIFPDVLKLDVEGYELTVLFGAKETLKKCKVVQFEFGGCNIDTRTYFQDFWYFFSEQGFTLYRMTPRGLTSISRYQESDEFFSTTNYLAIRAN